MISLAFSGDSVELPNPRLGDSIIHKNNANINRSMNGTLWITKTLANKEIKWNFETVDRLKIKELEVFLRTNKGEPFTVTNHKGSVFTAYITEAFQSTDNGRGFRNLTDEEEPVCEESPASGSFSLTLERV